MIRALVLFAVAVAALADEKKSEKPVPALETGIERQVRQMLKPNVDPGDWCKTPYVFGWPVVVPVKIPPRPVVKAKTRV